MRNEIALDLFCVFCLPAEAPRKGWRFGFNARSKGYLSYPQAQRELQRYPYASISLFVDDHIKYQP